jgi:hypothetical protein
MTGPINVGRSFDEILRVIHSFQTSVAEHNATPADWTPGGKAIIPTTPPPGVRSRIRAGGFRDDQSQYRRQRLPHPEGHMAHSNGWLSTAALGADDSIVSTASLIMGPASAGFARCEAPIAGLAVGMIFGANT